MTTDNALFHVESPELPLPPAFLASGPTAQIVDGIPVWFAYYGDECDYRELYIHTHREDRALDVATRMAREFDADYDHAEITRAGWCRLVTECGCTPEQHTTHADLDGGCEADCGHPELPPCNSDPLYSWIREDAAEGAPGALPYVRVVLSSTIYHQTRAAVAAGELLSAPDIEVPNGRPDTRHEVWFEGTPPPAFQR